MKRRNEAGFSLIEVLVAITILAAVVLPTCSALVLGVQLNEKSDKLMHAQLAVSSAVETLMAEGIPSGTPDTAEGGDYGANSVFDRFPEVKITVARATVKQNDETVGLPYYNVTVASNETTVISNESGTSVEALVTVTTTVAEASAVAQSPTESPTESPDESTETTPDEPDPGEEGTP